MRDLALGLAALGFKRGDKLSVDRRQPPAALLSPSSPRRCLGGVSVPVYQDSIASELVYVLNHAETSVIVAEDQEQVDKVLSLKDQLPKLRWIIYDDPRGLSFYDDPILRSLRRACWRRGGSSARPTPASSRPSSPRAAPTTSAMIAYTSGTTGSPKGAMLSHAT